MDIIAGLNSRQLEAVRYKSGPMMIVAGPGSGKTRTITCRMAWLIQENGVLPEKILAITFTNRAAAEMAQRLTSLLGQGQPVPLAVTFHAFCLEVLKETGQQALVIMDDYDRRKILKEVLEQVPEVAEALSVKPAGWLDAISAAKQNMLSPGDDLAGVPLVLSGQVTESQLAVVYSAYQESLSFNNACDYEDLIFKVVKLWEQNGAFRESYQQRFSHVFIDEYQDLNYGQYRLVRSLVPAGGDICVIGDPDQAIYGFRGSSSIYFDHFQKDYTGVKAITLAKNYRSTETILAASYDVITRQAGDKPRVRVYSGVEHGAAITLAQLDTDKAEGVFIGKTIEKLVGGLGFHSIDFGQAGYDAGEELAFSDLAVLTRTRAQSKDLAKILESAGIPCQVVNKENLLARKGLSELLSFLRLVEGLGSWLDFRRLAVVQREAVSLKALGLLSGRCRKQGWSVETMLTGIGRLPVDGLEKKAQRTLSVLAGDILSARQSLHGWTLVEKINHIVENHPEIKLLIGSGPQVEAAWEQLLTAARAATADSRTFFDTLSLVTEADSFLPSADRVLLMTMHAAKGLEFPVVFIAGCEEGFLPYEKSVGGAVDRDVMNMDVVNNNIDEERRLFYVAITRARQQLFLSYVKKRRIYEKLEKRRISPFVEDIESDLKNQVKSKTGVKTGPTGPVQMELF